MFLGKCGGKRPEFQQMHKVRPKFRHGVFGNVNAWVNLRIEGHEMFLEKKTSRRGPDTVSRHLKQSVLRFGRDEDGVIIPFKLII